MTTYDNVSLCMTIYDYVGLRRTMNDYVCNMLAVTDLSAPNFLVALIFAEHIL